MTIARPWSGISTACGSVISRPPAAGAVRSWLVPCWIDPQARPVPLQRDERGEAMFEYLRHITASAKLNAQYAWEGGHITVSAAGERA